MIVADTSALMAIVLDEPAADACSAALEPEHVLISAGTAAETMIVAGRKSVRDQMNHLLAGFDFDVVSMTASSAKEIAEAYRLWGRRPSRSAELRGLLRRSAPQGARLQAALCGTRFRAH